MKQIDENWWKVFFDNEDYYATYDTLLSDEITQKNILGLKKFLPKNKDIKILETACGNGRFSFSLSKLGYKNIDAYDFSRVAIKKAIMRQKEINNIDGINFFRGDMRTYVKKDGYDLIINLFSSYGYSLNESDHVLILKNIFNSLKPGGIFIFDLRNGNKLFNDFSIKPQRIMEDVHDDTKIITTEEFDFNLLRVIVSRVWNNGGYYSSMRMFTYQEIINMCNLIGFKIKKTLGGFSGADFDISSSPRMIFILKKPE